MLESNVKYLYVKHEKKRISQGDILKNFDAKSIYDDAKVVIPYLIVLSQDCDLESISSDLEQIKSVGSSVENIIVRQFLPHILVAPAFIYERVIDNTYLQEIYKVTPMVKWSGEESVLRQQLKNNKMDRYHYFKQYEELPALVIDFKCYFSVSILDFLAQYDSRYLITVNELFRESLSQRFANYLCRIGLPVL